MTTAAYVIIILIAMGPAIHQLTNAATSSPNNNHDKRKKDEMSENQLIKALNNGQCPDCAGTTFYLGPRGGESQNIKCTACGAQFNVTPRPNTIHLEGTYVWADRIPRD